jgi:hypothetical protein
MQRVFLDNWRIYIKSGCLYGLDLNRGNFGKSIKKSYILVSKGSDLKNSHSMWKCKIYLENIHSVAVESKEAITHWIGMLIRLFRVINKSNTNSSVCFESTFILKQEFWILDFRSSMINIYISI